MVNITKQTTINVNEKANLIWATADIIRDLYKPHEYGKVILPMTVIKRFNDTLLPTKDNVLQTYEQVKQFEVKDVFLETAAGYSFYNISPFTFENLLADSENIEANFRSFLAGFSENVQDVLENFEFDKEITKLANNNALFAVIQEFNTQKAYMGPDVITSTDMGYIFEELVRRFSESYNEQAGAHFTARDIIYLMTDLLICEEKNTLIEEGVVKTIYDMTMGTSQMLACMEERLTQLDSEANVKSFGQEINPETYAIAKADMIIKGGKADDMKLGNTLSDDKFKDYTFDYIISNPPFGIDWKKEKSAVEKENELGDAGRFGVGLPKISDGQMLFTLNGIKKLKDTGRMAIIHNGSPLFSGDAGSGPSEIRRYIIENDWLEAIVQLPTDLFYNTGISTYIWIISKDKPLHREGKVQLIDASKMYEKRRKSIGSKRNEITEECRDMIVQAYGDFQNKEYTLGEKTVESKIFENIDFGYNKIVIESPTLDEYGNIVYKNKKMVPDTSKRDSENVPLDEDIDAYFKREVLPYNPNAWIDKKKTKVGYEIPFTRYFYKYVAPQKADEIKNEILEIEKELDGALMDLFKDDFEEEFKDKYKEVEINE
ncbi:type I restriction-modification system subunit M [Clostridium sp.]|uniref:type I restriction-modification system subunit M n=1 Tax=Clostridium sp. TaxID=1506 RepID=UPI001DDD1878|nr:type I restriction-modification system subunit M [Clostridium sp.]MBS5937605.1 N-6 DNA methylase [Clostridium sp.]